MLFMFALLLVTRSTNTNYPDKNDCENTKLMKFQPNHVISSLLERSVGRYWFGPYSFLYNNELQSLANKESIFLWFVTYTWNEKVFEIWLYFRPYLLLQGYHQGVFTGYWYIIRFLRFLGYIFINKRYILLVVKRRRSVGFQRIVVDSTSDQWDFNAFV